MAEEPPDSPLIVVGSARLPKAIAGEHLSCLMIELVLDPRDDHILDVTTSVPLPGHTALLRRLLIGRDLDDVERAARNLWTHYRGSLLRPTMAALINAVDNSKQQTPDAGLPSPAFTAAPQQ